MKKENCKMHVGWLLLLLEQVIFFGVVCALNIELAGEADVRKLVHCGVVGEMGGKLRLFRKIF